MRCASAVLTPSRSPWSISCRRPQSYRLWSTNPIFPAMDCVAAHNDGWSPRLSRTIRTARSWTSGENFGVLLKAPSSQELEPPKNPGRFTAVVEDDVETTRHGDDQLAQPGVGVAAAFAAAGHVVQELRALDVEVDVAAAFDERQVAVRVGHLRQVDPPALV
jgi:hypothetical protein